MNKAPFAQVASAVTLTSSLAAVGGDATSHAVKLGDLTSVDLSIDYTRHASSTTGRPVVAVDLSRDAPTTDIASVAHWQPYSLVDGGSFSAGAVEAYAFQAALNPTAAGTTTFGWPGHIIVAGYHWMRLRMKDADGSNPGTASVYFGGTQ
jgi:hypothetical protein